MIVAFSRRDSVWMVQTKFGLEYLHRPTIERLGLVILALDLKQTGEVVVIDSNVGMILAERLFIYLDGPTIEWFSPVILALVLKQKGEVVVIDSNAGMIL